MGGAELAELLLERRPDEGVELGFVDDDDAIEPDAIMELAHRRTFPQHAENRRDEI